MPTSPRSKTPEILKKIRNILQRADVSIGPYINLF